MKALRIFTTCAAVVMALTAAPASAWDSDGRRPSVFPRPADPWRHWGTPAPAVVSPRPVVPHRGAFVSQPVWVRGFWGWNGYTWIWIPGHWAW